MAKKKSKLTNTKYIIVVGGVMSGVGKGITSASIGNILQSKGFTVTTVKADPYLNVDAGTMNPIEHGEVFVTEDGVECDQDIGNYERFTSQNMFSDNYMTAGLVYLTVITKERNLEYKGKCVESVPDLTNEIIRRIKKAGKICKADFTIIEIGGTVGEDQNGFFLEAARILSDKERGKVAFVLVSFLPIPKSLGEAKTKPTQMAIKLVNAKGIFPNFVIARADKSIDEIRKEKIAVGSSLARENIISAPDIKCIYQVPLNFEKDDFGNKILKFFKMGKKKSETEDWEDMLNIAQNCTDEIKIGIVGKYFVSGKFTLMDAYISVIEAIKFASWKQKKNPVIEWLNAESYQDDPESLKDLDNYDAIIVPGGFGNRGIEGKIKALEYCRNEEIPVLGLCLGMQLMIVEYSRNVCGLKDANSTEMNSKTPHPVIHIMEEQKKNLKMKNMGASMRLGAYDCKIKTGTKAFSCYQKEDISERHRHRYEFNNDYRETLENNGMVFSGINLANNLVEISELPDHPFYLGCQFHPEFKSRPVSGHPLFNGLIEAGIKRSKKRK